jgi:hypothetical protein
MNLTVIAVAAFLVLASTVGAYVKGVEDGKDKQIATEKREDDVRAKTYADAQSAAASAIAGITIKQINIKGRVEHETTTVPVYTACHNTPDGMRALNDALTNTVSNAPSGVELSASAATH